MNFAILLQAVASPNEYNLIYRTSLWTLYESVIVDYMLLKVNVSKNQGTIRFLYLDFLNFCYDASSF